ncbi:MAG: MaoC family dehydratase, partial [Proteobacteria bacterium]|nr:MaoC family dehydratase [Pseudomonadota bacterium]
MNHRRTTSSEWKLLSNTASAQKGSIHDDDAARSLGFRRAFVPGSLVANFAVPSILEHFGSTWLQGGWYDFNFVSPVYIDEEVRTIAGETDGRFACRVETRDGRLCAQGLAGMQAKLPWQTKGALADVFPGVVIGT